MKAFLRIFLCFCLTGLILGSVSCETSHPKPPRSKVGTLPHNRPAPWEGNPMGMPTSM